MPLCSQCLASVGQGFMLRTPKREVVELCSMRCLAVWAVTMATKPHTRADLEAPLPGGADGPATMPP